MKTNYRLAIALLAVLIITAFTSKANTNAGKEETASALIEKQVSIQYSGTAENSVVFRVAFENPAAQKFSLIIKNDAGDVLYSGQFTDAHFSKAIHLLKEDSEMNPVFIIRAGNQKVEQAFKVNVNPVLEEEVIVSKQ